MTGTPTIGRVVIAGGSGAVGSLFAEQLQESGNDVVIVDRDVPGPTHRVTRFVRGDISDPGAEVADVGWSERCGPTPSSSTRCR
jgi:prephenate dehydrogenase